jgi:hypothetical protein
MNAQSERLRLEYRDSVARARDLVSGSGLDALRRKGADGGWCAAECLDHLNLSTEDSMRRIREALAESSPRPARREEKLSLVGRFIVRNYEPPARRRYTAAATVVPAAAPARIDLLVAKFEQTHAQLVKLLEETDAIDRMRIKVSFADYEWLHPTLFDTFCIIAAHDRRHLWQAERAARV